jgi:hypothetical protein
MLCPVRCEPICRDSAYDDIRRISSMAPRRVISVTAKAALHKTGTVYHPQFAFGYFGMPIPQVPTSTLGSGFASCCGDSVRFGLNLVSRKLLRDVGYPARIRPTNGVRVSEHATNQPDSRSRFALSDGTSIISRVGQALQRSSRMRTPSLVATLAMCTDPTFRYRQP